MTDAGAVLSEPYGHTVGAVGRDVFGAAKVIFIIFSMVSEATCTMVWGVIGPIICWLVDLPRTLKQMSWLSVASFISLLSAVFIAMISVGVCNPAATTGGFHAIEVASFPKASLSVTNIVLAYAGHVAFFSFISERKNPAHSPKALSTLRIADTGLYFVVAMVIYGYGGTMVDSPALGTGGDVVENVAWGMAMSTIVNAGIIYGHVAGNYMYHRLLTGTKQVADREATTLGSWTCLTITETFWVVAWVIAESIPDFNDMLALVEFICSVVLARA